MGQRSPRAQRKGGSSHRQSAFALMALLLLLATTLLTACASDAHQMLAQQDKAKLDAELRHARVDLGVPSVLLQPIERQETKIANGQGGWDFNYQNAASNYALLYTQLLGVEQTATQMLQRQAGLDLQAFATALAERRQDGFIEADAYQVRLQQAQQNFSNARTPGDFLKVATLATAQTQALDSMWPAYQKLIDLQNVLKALGSSGIDTTLAQSAYNQDLQIFQNAATADRYQTLVEIIDGQVLQLVADQNEDLPYVGSALLAAFQARIDLLKSYGAVTSVFQKQHDQDEQALAAAHALVNFQQLAQTVDGQVAAMALPLIKGKAYYDLATLTTLVDAVYTNPRLAEQDPFEPGVTEPGAYEYHDSPTNGLQDVTNTLNQAQTEGDYQASDDDIVQLLSNLRADLDNMKDKTPAGQPHATDLELMQQFGILRGRTMVVSLREQVARLYENGKLVYWTYVTTGMDQLPSVPGLHTAMYKGTHLVFTSAEPKSSPFWYAPTPINYGILYANYGFFVHDAWWRSQFGPGTNLPHYDPAAFNSGSHGCINMPLANMVYVYNWLPLYAPILVY